MCIRDSNRPGAGGQIAADLVARANADGYTLLFANSGMLAINPWIYKLHSDPAKAFAPVSLFSDLTFVLVVPASLPAKDVPELVEPGECLGKITPEAAAWTGIPAGLPLIASGSDKGCETLGSGCVDAAVASLSFGTTSTVQLTIPKYVEPQQYLPCLLYTSEHIYKNNLSLVFARRIFHAFCAAWTVRQPSEMDETRFDLFIFENFLPPSHSG